MMLSVTECPHRVCLWETLDPDHLGSLCLALGGEGILILYVCEGHSDCVMLCVSEGE